jgi:hypothetical protein
MNWSGNNVVIHTIQVLCRLRYTLDLLHCNRTPQTALPRLEFIPKIKTQSLRIERDNREH